MDEAAQVLHVALAGCGQNGAGTEEQQALKNAVIEHVKQRRSHRERCGSWHAVRRERQRETKANENDADVLHRMISEQALKIVLHERAQNPENASDPREWNDHSSPP